MATADQPTHASMGVDEIRPQELDDEKRYAYLRDVGIILQSLSEFEDVNCPACGSQDHAYQFTKIAFRFVSCKKCETLYMNPRPSRDLMNRYYLDSENYRFWASRIFPLTESSRRDKIARPSLERIISACDRHNFRPQNLVEIGPGFGTFLGLASDSGVFDQVIGIEPTPELAEACKQKNLTILSKPIEEVDPQDLPPDAVVVAFEVIEHLHDPVQFLSAAHQVLPQGALLFLSFPNGKGFDIQLLREKSTAIDLEHVNLFNAFSIGILLERTGFLLLECSTPGRLDVELVREGGIAEGLDFGPFLNRMLFDEPREIRESFQSFLAQFGFSSHMWVVAKRT